MEILYGEIGNILDDYLTSFNESEEKISTSLDLTITDGISEGLKYQITFVYIHDSIYMIGGCYGGGYSFFEEVNDWIGINEINESLTQVVKSNFDKMGLNPQTIETV